MQHNKKIAVLITDRARQYWRLMRFDKPIGIFLLLWPALWALWVAGDGYPDPLVFIVISTGVVIMRAAGCVINDYADRGIDRYVERTQHRPIAAGKVTATEALVLFVILCLLAFGLVLLLNRLTITLSVVGALLAVSYPFMKRYTYFAQVHLGVAFGWAVPMVFAAQTGGLPGVSWLLYLATIFWALAYDTMYAMVDREDDLRIGVKSTAILFNKLDRVLIGVIQTLVLLTLISVGIQVGMSWPFYVGLMAATGFGIYQQKLIHDRSKEGCFKAFLNNNWFGLSVFCGIVVHYLII